MASVSPIVLESAALEVADAASYPVAPPIRDRADPRPVPLPLGEHRARELGGMLALIAVVAVAGPLVVAVAGMVVVVAGHDPQQTHDLARDRRSGAPCRAGRRRLWRRRQRRERFDAPPTTASGRPATVDVANSGLGKILVDSQGRTLYLFKKDSGTKSACTGACASAWPPLRANGKPTVGGGANASMVGTTTRSDGKPQVTYNGHPLYLSRATRRPATRTARA